MKVTNATVRFMRKVQVRDYEPIEAELSFQVQSDEGEDVGNLETVFTDYLATAKAAVMNVLTGTVAKTEGSVVNVNVNATGVAEAAKPKRGRPPKATTADIPDTGQQISNSPEDRKPVDDGIPDSAPAGKIAIDDGIPSDDMPSGTLSGEDLQKWVGEQVQAKKIKVEEVRTIYAEWNASRAMEIPADQRTVCQDKIKAFVANKEQVADL